MSKKSNPKKLQYQYKTFQIELNSEQKETKNEILKNDISILIGKSGSGKTLLACDVALELYLSKQIEKIVITRPTISKEELGLLPGNIDEKMLPWIYPIKSNLQSLLPKDIIIKLENDGIIEIVPLTYMRGRTFTKSCIIVDEFQNCENGQLEMVIQRLGLDSKMILCGDKNQIDLKNPKKSSFFMIEGMEIINGVYKKELISNHRHPILEKIFEFFESKRIF